MRPQHLIGTAYGALVAAVVLALGVVTWAAPQPARHLGRGGLALDGYDVVAYFVDSKAVKGDPRFEFTWDGARWRFVSAEHRDRFAADPQQYAPQYGGYCAYAVSQGHTASADPEQWSVVNGRLYVNYSASVRATWERDTPGYITKADANWPGVLSK